MLRTLRSLALVAVVAAAPLSAQSKFGLVGGMTSSTISSEDDISSYVKSRSGFAFGISMGGGSGKIAFAPELLYVNKGYAVDLNSFGAGDVNLSYVEAPLLFRASFGQSKTKPFLTLGPTIAMKISCKVSAEDESEDCDTGDDEESLLINSTDIGVMAGAGVDFGRFSVSARYEMGMTNIVKDNEGNSVKNKSLMLLAGFKF